MSSPCPPGNVNIPLEILTKPEKRTCLCTPGTGTRVPESAQQQRRKIRRVCLSHRSISRAIDLSCRACGAGAGCWAWIPGWGTCGVHPQPPIKRNHLSPLKKRRAHIYIYIYIYTYRTKLKLDKEVGDGVLLMRWACNLDCHTSLHTLVHT